MTSKTATTLRRDPCRSATKNFRNMTAASGPFIDFSLVGTNKYTSEQASVKAFFRQNPTPARAAFLDEEDNNPTAEIPIHTTRVNNATSKNDFPTTADDATPPSPAMALPPLPAGLPPIGSAPPKFFAQLIQTMKSLQAPQLPPKIIVESRDHQESVDLAKLQTSMLKLMYVSGDIDWDEATIKNIRLATFSKGFKNLLDRTASVQVTQLSNLFVTVFTTEPEDDDDDTATNPLNRLMSLSVFPQKFTKAHLNASFQSVDLETGSIYKSTSINPFHYAPQTNRVLVKAANSEMEEERNEMNWKIVEKDRKQISSMIEGVGRITSMNDVAMTCANVCGVQLAIVDVSTSKPILYQFAWKLIKFIENKKTKTWMRDNKDAIAHLPMVFMGKIHQLFQHLASFSQNSINTNKVEIGDVDLETKQITIAVKFASKFITKMLEHIDENSIPKNIPAFAKSLFVEAPEVGITETIKRSANQISTTANEGGRRKLPGGDDPGSKKPRKEFSDRSLKMGLFHIRKGTLPNRAFPDRTKLKDGAGICHDFNSHGYKCPFPHQLCKTGKHFTNWKHVPDNDKLTILKHMDETGSAWLDAETFEKHNSSIPPEFAHLLGDASGPKNKTAKKSM